MSKDKDPRPSVYYKDLELQESRMHRLVALRLKNAMLSNAYYRKGDTDNGYGLFDIVDPHEEADSMIEDLRFFGFIPPEKAEKVSGKDE